MYLLTTTLFETRQSHKISTHYIPSCTVKYEKENGTNINKERGKNVR